MNSIDRQERLIEARMREEGNMGEARGKAGARKEILALVRESFRKSGLSEDCQEKMYRDFVASLD